jgi:hypothetical protein
MHKFYTFLFWMYISQEEASKKRLGTMARYFCNPRYLGVEIDEDGFWKLYWVKEFRKTPSQPMKKLSIMVYDCHPS